MSLLVNLRHLQAHDLDLQGELSEEELDLDIRDEVIRIGSPLHYGLEVQKLEDALLIQGHLALTLDCQCVRCLKPFQYQLKLDPWTSHLPLAGEEAVAIVNDCVDLTAQIREDILLEFPQHPLCEQECRGLPKTFVGKPKTIQGASQTENGSSAWGELNKLKFKKS